MRERSLTGWNRIFWRKQRERRVGRDRRPGLQSPRRFLFRRRLNREDRLKPGLQAARADRLKPGLQTSDRLKARLPTMRNRRFWWSCARRGVNRSQRLLRQQLRRRRKDLLGTQGRRKRRWRPTRSRRTHLNQRGRRSRCFGHLELWWWHLFWRSAITFTKPSGAIPVPVPARAFRRKGSNVSSTAQTSAAGKATRDSGP